jgi:hypothetical protein
VQGLAPNALLNEEIAFEYFVQINGEGVGIKLHRSRTEVLKSGITGLVARFEPEDSRIRVEKMQCLASEASCLW